MVSLTSDGVTFNMLDIKEKLFRNGPANTCNLARLTHVPVPAHALVALLRGEAPVLVHDPSATSIRMGERWLLPHRGEEHPRCARRAAPRGSARGR